VPPVRVHPILECLPGAARCRLIGAGRIGDQCIDYRYRRIGRHRADEHANLAHRSSIPPMQSADRGSRPEPWNT